jgi:ATP-binding cassette subfamily B protein IrtB
MAGRTVVMVAHRLRTVQRADQVAFLAGGRIVASGSHEELLRSVGRYADFWSVVTTAGA